MKIWSHEKATLFCKCGASFESFYIRSFQRGETSKTPCPNCGSGIEHSLRPALKSILETPIMSKNNLKSVCEMFCKEQKPCYMRFKGFSPAQPIPVIIRSVGDDYITIILDEAGSTYIAIKSIHWIRSIP